MTNSGTLVLGYSTKLSNLSVFSSAVLSALLCAAPTVSSPPSPPASHEWLRNPPGRSESSLSCQSHGRIEPQLGAQTTQISLPPLARGKDQGFSHIIAPGRG